MARRHTRKLKHTHRKTRRHSRRGGGPVPGSGLKYPPCGKGEREKTWLNGETRYCIKV